MCRGSGSRFGFGRCMVLAGLCAAVTTLGCSGGSSGGGPGKAEIEIVSFTHTVNGSLVNYSVEITNSGGRDAENFNVDLYWDRTTAPPAALIGDDTQFVLLLARGETRTVPFARFGTPPGSYLSWAQVDTDEVVDEKDEGNNVSAPVPVTVTAPPAPDLLITDLVANVTNLDVEYTITVENQGTGDAGPFWIDLYYHHQGPPPQPQEAGDDFILVSGGLTAASSLTLKRTRTSSPPGIFESYAQADTLEQVTESDETNNVFGPTQVTVAAPNTPELLISSFTATASGQDVNYDVTVENIGTVDATIFEVDIYYDRPTAPAVGIFGDDSQVVGSLQGGTSTQLVFTRIGAPTGGYQSWVQADSFDAVAETFEDNNIDGPKAVLVGPELEVVYFRSDFVGQDVEYTVVLENFGSQDAGPFYVDLYYDWVVPPIVFDLGDDFANPAGLPSGTMITELFTLFTPVGDYFSWVQADTDDQIVEVDETNNVRGSLFFNRQDAIAAELEITSVTTTVTGPTVTYDVEVTNNGGTDATNFVVDVYLHRPVAPDPLDFGSTGFGQIALLAPAGSATIPIVVTATSGTYRSWVQVDTDRLVVEANEGNNVYPMINLTVP